MNDIVNRAAPPAAATDLPVRPHRPGSLRGGVRLEIDGRTVHLRHLRRPPTGPRRWLFLLGPGMIAAMASDDAGGIATFSSAGAQFGYELLWVLLLISVAQGAVLEMSARLGAASGRGLLDLVRERFGVTWALLAVGVVLVANGGVVASEFVGLAAAAELLGLSRYLAVPAGAAVVWYLVIFGNYRRVEKVFIAMTLAFLAYPVAAVLARPDWSAVARGALVPTVRLSPSYLDLLVGLVGTTIAPYAQLYQQSSMVERGTARRHYHVERASPYAGSVSAAFIAATIVIATGATLHAAGETNIQSAADAARALRPSAGSAAQLLFAVALLGASLLAAGVVPIATAYSVSEAFGFRKGIDLDFRRAPFFLGVFSSLIAAGAAAALVPNVPIIPMLVGLQVINGALLPVLLIFLLLLSNDRRLMGTLRNGPLSNLLGGSICVLVGAAVLVSLGSRLLAAWQ